MFSHLLISFPIIKAICTTISAINFMDPIFLKPDLYLLPIISITGTKQSIADNISSKLYLFFLDGSTFLNLNANSHSTLVF